MNNIINMIKTNDFIKIALILLAVYLFMRYTQKDTMNNVDPEYLENDPVIYEYLENDPGIYEYLENVENKQLVQPMSQQPQALAPTETQQQKQIDGVVAGKDQLQAGDLLPKYDEANEFAKQNPISNLLKEQNFLISGYHVGINTVMQSNKIPYHDIRSAPPIPKENVGPWGQSSFETPMGSGRRMLEIL